MATTPPRLTLPIAVGTAQIGTVEVDLEVSSEHSGQTVNIKTSGNVDQAIAEGLVEAAERLAPGITSPVRWATGIDQPVPGLEWPTTPGSAVLADRHHGVGPQVLVAARSVVTGGIEWWGAHDRLDAAPSSVSGGWTWGGQSNRYDLLQILYVAP